MNNQLIASMGINPCEPTISYLAAVQSASMKLQRIIEREGDNGGYRLTHEYMNRLVCEAMREQAAAMRYSVSNYQKALAV